MEKNTKSLFRLFRLEKMGELVANLREILSFFPPLLRNSCKKVQSALPA